MTRWNLVLVVSAVAAATIAGCASAGSTPSTMTGLTGVVMRGPVTPVCRVDVPCDAPFSATFEVYQNSRRVARFQSDADGRFSVTLRPGMYRVIPGADAPIIQPPTQVKSVEVLPVGNDADSVGIRHGHPLMAFYREPVGRGSS